jgi:hypothetical protein
LYAFYKGHWYSIPSIIWNQLNKFWEGVLWKKTTTANSWGLPFPFLLTHIMKKKGIKGTHKDGPITKHPFFGRNQWNHSQSHMPRGLRAQIPAKERVEEAKHMEEDAPTPQQGGRRRSVVISQTEYDFLHGANQRLERMEQHFANIEQQFNTQGEILKAILERLPLVARESSSVSQGEHQ